MRERLLRRLRVSSKHQGLHSANGRSVEHGQGRQIGVGRSVRRRAERTLETQQTRCSLDGQQGTQHERQSIFHNLLETEQFRHEVYDIWSCHRRHGHARRAREHTGRRENLPAQL